MEQMSGEIPDIAKTIEQLHLLCRVRCFQLTWQIVTVPIDITMVLTIH